MATIDDINSTLQNVAQQIGLLAKTMINAAPAQTTTASPKSTSINNLGTAIATVIGTSTLRHGIIFHNPGTVNVYLFPTLNTAVATNAVGGAFIILPAGSLSLPSTTFPNVNCGWSAWATTGSNQPLTVVEFF